MTRQYLSLRDIAEKTGIPLNTVKSLELRGKLPDPDVVVGSGERQQKARGWSEATIDTWWGGYAQKSPGGNN